MAKRHHRLLSAMLIAALLSTSAFTAFAADVEAAGSGAGSLSKYYSTNGSGVGKEAKITIDGDASDWNESMKVAQGAAWDVANHWKGGHENCVLDTYALYAAWDDSNLYIGWQMVNTTDTWARSGDGPLSDGGRVLDVPLIIALSTNPNATAMTGKTTDGKGIWGADISYQTHVDTLLYMSGKPGLGTPGFFKAADSSGAVDYTNKNSCKTFAETGVEYKMATTNINDHIWGLNSSSDPSDVCDNNADWVDYKTYKGSEGTHDTTFDSFYEAKIPFSALGISKSQLTENGIGAMVIASRGESGLDCVPFDLTMLDNATGSYSTDPSTSAEKDDADVITAPLASIGNGEITPPTPDSDTESEADTASDVVSDNDTESETIADSDSNTDTEFDIGWQVLPLTTKAKAGETVTVKLGLSAANNLFGVSANVKFEPGYVEYISAKSLYSGVQVNKKADDEIKWNANLGDGTKGVNITKDTPMVEIKFKALKDLNGYFGATAVSDVYDYDFNSISASQYIDIKAASPGDTDIQSDTDSQTDIDIEGAKEMTVNAKANKGDTVFVKFNADLSKIEGVSNTFVYDADLLDYAGCDKNKSVNVEVNQSTGIIRWNCINTEAGSKADIAAFRFTAKSKIDGKIGTNTIREIYDANGNDLDYSVIKASVSVKAGEDTDIGHEDVTADKKIDLVAKKGDRVVVTFDAKNAKNAAGIQAVLDYDKSLLKYNSDAASPVGVISAAKYNGRVAWNILFDLSKKGGANLSAKSEIAVMSFVALKDIKASDSALAYKVVDFYDNNDNAFDADSTVSASATVAKRGEGKVPVTAKAGNYVIAECKAIDASKALGIVEQLTYDKSALTYLGYEKEMGHFEIDTATSGAVRWSTMFDAKGTDLTKETDIVLIKFAANKDISSSDNVLSYLVEEFYDVNLKDFDTSDTTMVYAHAVSDENQYVIGDNDSDSEDDSSDIGHGGNDSDSSDSELHIGSDTDSTNQKVTILYGDVNKDDDVNSGDALTVLRVSVDLAEFQDEEAEAAADVNTDETVNADDALNVLRFSVSLPTNTKAGQRAEITIKFKSNKK